MKTQVPLADAERVARRVMEELAPSCLRLEIAGSVRRCKPLVSDIELVAIPRMVPGQMDLFGETAARNLLDEHCARLLAEGEFAQRLDKNGRPANGERFKRLAVAFHDWMPLDLFICLPPAQFGVLYTIRTGCAAFSHRLVTPRLMGGWLPSGAQVRDGAIWVDGHPLPMPEEAEVFRFLQAPWIDPAYRTDTVTLYRARGEWRWREPRQEGNTR